MEKRGIDSIVYLIKQAKKNNQPKPIVMIGAGASYSANIPLASVILNDILMQFEDKPEIARLSEIDKADYYKVMGALNSSQRNELLRGYIMSDKVRINVSHIYLAQLLKEDYVDYVLTVNFDDIMLKACALFDFIPPIYDVAVLNDFTTTTFQDKSVTYLHGQYHGLWLLNTPNELQKVRKSVELILNKICNKRTWIVVGYSGQDEVLDEIAKLNRFDNDLYWVGYLQSEPSEKVKSKLLEKPNANTYLVQGYHSDSFFMELHAALNLDTPPIFHKPFSFLKELMENITDISAVAEDSEEHKKHTKNVSDRFRSAKASVEDARNQYELQNSLVNKLSTEDISIEIIKQEIRDAIAKKEYDKSGNALISRYKSHPSPEIKELLSSFCFDWGHKLQHAVNTKLDIKRLNRITEKYELAISFNSRNALALNNWGVALHTKAQDDRDLILLDQSIAKYAEAVAIENNNPLFYLNWGIALCDLGVYKQEDKYFAKGFEKYAKAISLNSDFGACYKSWAKTLYHLALNKKSLKYKEEADQKYSLAHKIISSDELYLEWAENISKWAELTSDTKSMQQSCTMCRELISRNPRNSQAMILIGHGLGRIAEWSESVSLFQEALDFCRRAIEIEDKNHGYFNNYSGVLLRYSHFLSGTARGLVLDMALEFATKATLLGSRNYNLACVFALLGQKDEALKELKLSLESKEIKASFVRDDKDWKLLLTDPDFLTLLAKFES